MQHLNTSKKEALLDRREKVWQLRVVDRLPYREIARRLNTTVWTVHQDAKWLVNNRIKALEGKDKELIATQNEIFEALLNRWLPVAMSEGGDSNDEQLAATDRIVKILSDQAKLFGFQTLPKAEAGVAKELGKGVAEGVIEAMARLAEKSRPRVIEAELVEQPMIENGSKT